MEITNPEAPKLQGTAYSCPANQAAAGTRIFATMPKKIMDDPIGFIEDGGGERHGEKDMHQHSTTDLPNQGQALAPREKLRLPGS